MTIHYDRRLKKSRGFPEAQRRTTSNEPRIPEAGSRIPNPARSLFPVPGCWPGSLCVLSGLCVKAVAVFVASPERRAVAKATGQKTPLALPSPCSPFPGLPASGGFPIPDVAFSQQVMHSGVCTYVSGKFRHFGVKNRSKRGQNRVKKGQKRRAIRHAHLNILGGHPLWR